MSQYIQLTEKEREMIDQLWSSGIKKGAIARALGRHASTIGREITRNQTLKPGKGNKHEKTQEDYRYVAEVAQIKACQNAKKPRRDPFQALKHEPLLDYIITHMKTENPRESWSPEIISGMLKKDYPDDVQMRISHETIYQFIYSPQGEVLELKKYLLRSHKTRKKQTGRSVVKSGERTKINERRDITERPVSIETREEFGHYEGDSILSGQKKGAALHTEVERKSRFIFAKKIIQKTAAYTLQAQQEIFEGLPKQARLTDTLDNGTENSQSYQLTKLLNIDVYYAKPYHSWERGSNENGNGMIRRFFAKGTDFSILSQEEIDQVVSIINHRPRKILGYRSAYEVFHEELAKIEQRIRSQPKQQDTE